MQGRRYGCMIHPDMHERDEKIRQQHKLSMEIHHIDKMIGMQINMSAHDNGIDDMTMMHGWIIMFLYEHRDEDIYQKDIEKKFRITKSSVTNILQLMEHKGYIVRKTVKGDARLKKLELTDEGIELKKRMKDIFNESEKKFRNCLEPDEQEQLLNLLYKIDDSISADINGRLDKRNAADKTGPADRKEQERIK